MPSLLPYNATAAERALEAAGVAAILLPIYEGLRDPWRCPAALLPWLAWSRSVDEWDDDWPDDRKREVIAASIEVHRHKGTIWSIRRALTAAGFGDAQIIERFGWQTHDGSFAHDGSHSYAEGDHWAEYRVILSQPIPRRQGALLRRLLMDVAPARCHLKLLDFTEVAYAHDATIIYDGTYTYGAT
ncbi:phage tail protein I [Paracoccus yeei]|uniref:Phage tail protein I n=1 Tax=Paracoccus yeei TaxID=147645 RepID=A0A386UIF6_9RHOB|nr:phage tail protein I [Paracoccus yeei]AYF00457.1 phage tail protein I [Paracoccus yeei]AZV00463.1 tail protein [Paracoccus phage vB_PyeM_Pyei1]